MPMMIMPMTMTVVMAVIVMSAAAASVMFVVVCIGISERRRQTPLQGGRLLFRRIARLDRECHDLGSQTDIIDLPQIVAA